MARIWRLSKILDDEKKKNIKTNRVRFNRHVRSSGPNFTWNARYHIIIILTVAVLIQNSKRAQNGGNYSTPLYVEPRWRPRLTSLVVPLETTLIEIPRRRGFRGSGRAPAPSEHLHNNARAYLRVYNIEIMTIYIYIYVGFDAPRII